MHCSKNKNRLDVSKIQQYPPSPVRNADGLYTELQNDFKHDAARQYSNLQHNFKKTPSRVDQGEYMEVKDSFKQSSGGEGDGQYSELQDVNDANFAARDVDRQYLEMQSNYDGDIENNSRINHSFMAPRELPSSVPMKSIHVAKKSDESK